MLAGKRSRTPLNSQPLPKDATLPRIASRSNGGLMVRNPATTEKLRNLISKIESSTESGALHWERQTGSAHRYARMNNNLLILGPSTPASASGVPRYLFITP